MAARAVRRSLRAASTAAAPAWGTRSVHAADESAGTLLVFKTYEHMSYALILTTTVRSTSAIACAIPDGDRLRRTCKPVCRFAPAVATFRARGGAYAARCMDALDMQLALGRAPGLTAQQLRARADEHSGVAGGRAGLRGAVRKPQPASLQSLGVPPAARQRAGCRRRTPARIAADRAGSSASGSS